MTGESWNRKSRQMIGEIREECSGIVVVKQNCNDPVENKRIDLME